MTKPVATGEPEHLRYLIEELQGLYTIGLVPPVEDVVIAMASGYKAMVAVLVRREGESLDDLRLRLNEVVGRVVMEGEEPVNEVADRGIQFKVTRQRMPRKPRGKS